LLFYQNVLGIDIILYDFEYIENDLEYRKWFKQKRLEEEPLINIRMLPLVSSVKKKT
jgi:hypothetical protein